MRCAVDTGGTFTDLAVQRDDGELSIFKHPTTPDDPIRGILGVLELAAEAEQVDRAELLGRIELLIHGTTRSTNAVLTGQTARTGLIASAGHPDVLLLREGGRTAPFDWTRGYPDPYVPRELTVEVAERIGAQGEVVVPLDEASVAAALGELRERGVEAVAVSLLWSIVNPAHELRVGELIEELLPGVPYTLSHALNPVLREYRRTSSAAIDASLKPLMGAYLNGLDASLRDAGFRGRLLLISTGGGLLEVADMASAPIHSIHSGPAMAPTAGRHYAQLDGDADSAIVADTGGTSYDVSLVRKGRIPMTRETWLGPVFQGHITGFPAVDVKSIGAGGGSIASVDAGGLLRVGPESAGADPGPVAYGRGGERPTVTDACLALGYIDPDYFLGGAMRLDRDAACAAIERHVAGPLGLDRDRAAAAIVALATEHMVQAIQEITVNQGVDPRGATLVAGGGAAGLNAVAIARRLGCPRVVVPETSATLSAAGALMSDIGAERSKPVFVNSKRFDYAAVGAALAELEAWSREFRERMGGDEVAASVELIAEARYDRQVWQLDVPLRNGRIDGPEDLDAFVADFQDLHEEVFAVRDDSSSVEIVGLRARATCFLDRTRDARLARLPDARAASTRPVFFADAGRVDAAVVHMDALERGQRVEGPAIVESSFTTTVVDPGATAERTPNGSLLVDTGVEAPPPPAVAAAVQAS